MRGLLAPLALCAVAALDNGLGRTPALAYSTWNRWLLDINATLVEELADALVSTGLVAAGYRFLNLDAGVWLHERDASGDLVANPARFPGGLKPIAAYLAARGLALGVYTDLGVGSCGPGPGSGGHWEQDAAFFASLPAAYVKVDNCGQPQLGGNPAAQLAAWRAVAAAVNATGHPMYLSICPKANAPANLSGPLTPYAREAGLYFPPPEWTREEKRALANSWLVEVRNNVDGWGPSTSQCTDVGAPCGMITNIDSQFELGKWEETGPGGLVDADMLEVCQFNGTVNHPGLSTSESRLHFYVWALLPSPLILSFDPRTLPLQPGGQACLDMVKNPEILAINQDPAVVGAALLAQGPAGAATSEAVQYQVLGRPLADAGAWAAALVNRGAQALNITLAWGALGLPRPSASASVRDVGARQDLGSFAASFTALVPARDAMILRVTQQ